MRGREPGLDDLAFAVGRRLEVGGALVRALIARPTGEPAAEQAEALALFEELTLPAAVFNATGAPRSANAAWRALLGEHEAAFPRKHVEEVLRTGAALHFAELDLTFDGAPVPCAAILRPLRDGAGATTGAIVLCSRLSGEHAASATGSSPAVSADALVFEAEHAALLVRESAARAEAEQANRLKDRFLAAVSHELRAPLTTMLLWERVLRDETAGPALRAQALDAIHESALSQSRLVGDLLDVSRGISGKLHVDLRPLDIERVLREALAAITPAASMKQISLGHRGAPILAEVMGDAARLRQVLDNLLTNAVKFTEPGGRVAVALAHQDLWVVIDVEDTGCGIAPAALPRLFEPFSQIDDSLSRVNEGLGLGLAISKQLVTLHHGQLTVASAGPGRGATFTVRLPIADAPAAGAQAAGRAHRTVLDGLRLLIVDDERRVRDALALLLEHSGARVDTAESAEHARAQLARHTFSAVVCDIAMPGEDGHCFIRGLRAEGSRERDLPAIALTALAMESDAALALASGFDLHFAKPIDFERLAEGIAALVARRVRART